MSSSKRVKRDTVDLVTPDRATDHRNGTNIIPAAVETDRLQKEVTHKNEVCFPPLGWVWRLIGVGYYCFGGVCGQDAKGTLLWYLYRVALSAV